VGADGWRWALGIWAVLALVAALPWLAVPARPGRPRHARAVRMRSLVHSPLAVALAVFFGLQAIEAYVIIGWSAQYLRDAGLSAATAGLLLGLNTVVVIPLNAVVPGLTVRPARSGRCCWVHGLLRRRLDRAVGRPADRCRGCGWCCSAVGMGTFAHGAGPDRPAGRTPETTAALSTVVQGWGYLLAGVGPLLVGVLRGATGGYTGCSSSCSPASRADRQRLGGHPRALRRRRGGPVRPRLVGAAAATTSSRWPAPSRR
jgi:CP family cyanate transporter-like MFS transporter